MIWTMVLGVGFLITIFMLFMAFIVWFETYFGKNNGKMASNAVGKRGFVTNSTLLQKIEEEVMKWKEQEEEWKRMVEELKGKMEAEMKRREEAEEQLKDEKKKRKELEEEWKRKNGRSWKRDGWKKIEVLEKKREMEEWNKSWDEEEEVLEKKEMEEKEQNWEDEENEDEWKKMEEEWNEEKKEGMICGNVSSFKFKISAQKLHKNYQK